LSKKKGKGKIDLFRAQFIAFKKTNRPTLCVVKKMLKLSEAQMGGKVPLIDAGQRKCIRWPSEE